MNSSGTRSVVCAGCDRKFKSDAALQQHIRDRKDAAHNTIPAESDNTPKKVVRATSTPKVSNHTHTLSQLLT